MTSPSTIAAATWRHARIELRGHLTGWRLLAWAVMPFVMVITVWTLSGTPVKSSTIDLAAYLLPGLITVCTTVTGMNSMIVQLASAEEDGSLLRAKSIPGALAAHLWGEICVVAALSLLPLVCYVAVMALAWPDLLPGNPLAWVTMIAVTGLGMLATFPVSVVIGAWCRRTLRSMMLSMVIYVLAALSGLFFPLSLLALWAQIPLQGLPFYWVGLGLRTTLLPADIVAVEVTQSWRLELTFVVLALWAIVGLALAPRALRHLSRRQSASVLAATRDRFLARGY
ncbi:hypothetical protein KEM60_00843 [Austwickia sp. TVS 96-490-7B]|uniref:ABC transporter permease n=1 Tax=Austwickia sp. TVS 96-490-7B TaxID=2830843 RepID=UPI001C597941|nr:ABC transporter permease [Austwickia sp. TVS 96-490-7B]MBW3084654.1 hypothetical protein [Austwickia sp. TVS 96-490-7B]